MLTYDSLLDLSNSREMPHAKLRGILREYLQILILKELYRNNLGKKLYFTGGTYLRLVHNLKRFSEDLDFDSDSITKNEFEELVKKLRIELKRIGLESQIKFDHFKNVYSSKLIFPTIEEKYNVQSKYSKKQGIVIKIETNQSKNKIKNETQVISGFGEFFLCVCTKIDISFANKIDALIKKERGRHVYDLIFMLSNNFPIDTKTLQRLGIKINPLKAISDRIASFSKAELKKQAETLRPFLFDEKEADLIVSAHEVLPKLLSRYKD